MTEIPENPAAALARADQEIAHVNETLNNMITRAGVYLHAGVSTMQAVALLTKATATEAGILADDRVTDQNHLFSITVAAAAAVRLAQMEP